MDDIVAKADIIVGNDGKVCDIIFDKEISLLLWCRIDQNKNRYY